MTVTSPTSLATVPPGPRGKIRNAIAFQRAPLKLLARAVAEYGDVVAVEIPRMPFVLINHPDHVDRVLKTHQRIYDRHGPMAEMARNFFGSGLATAPRPGWLAQRRLLQPAFHRKHITGFGGVMTGTIAETLDRWESVHAAGGALDIAHEMSAMTLRIVVRTLFGTEFPESAIRRFTAAVDTATRELAAYMQFPLVPLSVPTPGHRRFHAAMAVFDEIIYDMTAEQRRDESDDGSLLALMIQARDADTGESMDDARVRDEVLTMLFAGHETSASTLAWAWYSIGRHPEVEQQLLDEVDRVLGERTPTMADVPALVVAKQVILETLRLYSPAWQTVRQAGTDDEIGGFRIAAGTQIFWSYYLVHRHPDFWDDPERFDPGRFAGSNAINGDMPGFYPFGAGPRLCIGNTFAMAEMQLALAMTLQRMRLVSTDSTAIPAQAGLTLKMGRRFTARPAMRPSRS
ncbi:cytochrome P450 [Nocardia flavorosea]|uniref:cytochrome P450 n=1 Tax=Nocardia flavorosea TaxID=53429 RepID=UPI0018953B08|nr:cytochrome P450 [Nocardia flavorosea]MBF6351441.1 cytochrome P450 [Nocardia flavorosea]